MKTVTTTHNEISYSINIAIIEGALREKFGINDASHVMTVVAAHIWANIATTSLVDGEATWGWHEINKAVASVTRRLEAFTEAAK